MYKIPAITMYALHEISVSHDDADTVTMLIAGHGPLSDYNFDSLVNTRNNLGVILSCNEMAPELNDAVKKEVTRLYDNLGKYIKSYEEKEKKEKKDEKIKCVKT
jgi:hypothetical protein